MPSYVQTDASGVLPADSGSSLLPNPRIGVTPSGALRVSVANAPVVTAWGADTVTTAATGTNYTALASHAATRVILVNPSQILRFRRVGTTTYATLAAGTALAIDLIANTNELELRRDDGSNTQIAVNYIFSS